MLRSLKATPSVCLVLLRNRGAEVVLSHPVIFLNFSSSAGCSGCPEPSYLRSLMPSARYSPFFTSFSAFFLSNAAAAARAALPKEAQRSDNDFFFFNILFVLFLNFFLRERKKQPFATNVHYCDHFRIQDRRAVAVRFDDFFLAFAFCFPEIIHIHFRLNQKCFL